MANPILPPPAKAVDDNVQPTRRRSREEGAKLRVQAFEDIKDKCAGSGWPDGELMGLVGKHYCDEQQP